VIRPTTIMRAIAFVLAGAILNLTPAGPTRAQMPPMPDQPLGQLSGDAFDREFLQEMIMHHAMAVMMAHPVVANAQHQELKDLATSIISAQTGEISQMRAWLQSWYGVDMPDPMVMMEMMHSGMGSGASAMPAGADPHSSGTIPAASGMSMGVPPSQMASGASSVAMGDPQLMAMQEMSMQEMAMMDALSTLPAPRLETVFLSMMIPHHQNAIEMAKLVPDRATHQELKTLAAKIIATQSGEIDQMNQLLASWYNL
jgi:uncharacterized protein (DUF305 family)